MRCESGSEWMRGRSDAAAYGLTNDEYKSKYPSGRK